MSSKSQFSICTLKLPYTTYNSVYKVRTAPKLGRPLEMSEIIESGFVGKASSGNFSAHYLPNRYEANVSIRKVLVIDSAWYMCSAINENAQRSKSEMGKKQTAS